MSDKSNERAEGGFDPGIVRRTVDLDELLIEMRRLLRVDYEYSRADEWSAMVGRGTLQPVVDDVDVGALLAWVRLGARLLSGGFPSLKRMRDEVTRLTLALTLQRVDTISQASRVLSSSRKILRDNMHRTGLYPWPPRCNGSSYRR